MRRRIVLLGFVTATLLGTSANAGTPRYEARSFEAQRSRGLAAALEHHVLVNEPGVCDVWIEVEDVLVTPIASHGGIDYARSPGDERHVSKLPHRLHYEGLYLVTQRCTGGSTQFGAYTHLGRAVMWKVRYEQPRASREGRWGKRGPLRFERGDEITTLPAWAN